MSGSSGTTNEKDTAVDSSAPGLNTDHLLSDIGTRAISGGFVTVGAQGAKFLLNLTAAAILARVPAQQVAS